jgi:hypothetical protein
MSQRGITIWTDRRALASWEVLPITPPWACNGFTGSTVPATGLRAVDLFGPMRLAFLIASMTCGQVR